MTLVPSSEWANLPGADDYPSLLVWGVVYTIDPRHVKEVKEYLDVREKDGYEMTIVDVYKEQKGEEQLLTQVRVFPSYSHSSISLFRDRLGTHSKPQSLSGPRQASL